MSQAILAAGIMGGAVVVVFELVGVLISRYHRPDRNYHLMTLAAAILVAAYTYLNYLGR